MTHEDMLLELAGKMGPCQDLHIGVGSDRCKTCGLRRADDPGQVPRYPSLRRECPCVQSIACRACYDLRRKKRDDTAHSEHCLGSHCQGRGWVPVDDTDATLEAIRTVPPLERGKLARIIKNVIEDWILVTNPPAINEAVVYELWENTYKAGTVGGRPGKRRRLG